MCLAETINFWKMRSGINDQQMPLLLPEEAFLILAALNRSWPFSLDRRLARVKGLVALDR